MITIIACPNLGEDERYRVTIDLTNNNLGCMTKHFSTIGESLEFIRSYMSLEVAM